MKFSASLLEEEEAEEEARRCEVETNLLAEQEAGVAAVSAVAEGQKKSLEEHLEHAGASPEEKQVQQHVVSAIWYFHAEMAPTAC